MGNCARNVSHMYSPHWRTLGTRTVTILARKITLIKTHIKKNKNKQNLKLEKIHLQIKKKTKHSQSTSVKWSQTNRD